MVTVIDQIGQTGTTLNTYVNPCLTTLAKQRQLHVTEKILHISKTMHGQATQGN